ncbi:MAG: nucleic acid-binding protein [Acidobacteria bacterium RBG_16_68_9]|nr:MAG: nucleic acid-binding protein [Acidobacteria bacterium RBG_16_68_9]
MPEVIADTSPLQYLHQLGLLHLLPALYQRIIVPEAVVRELADGRARGVALPDQSALPWVTVRQPRERSLLALATDLGAGEREVLALAVETPGAIALLDDTIARRHARLLGVAFTGTLGVLLRAKASGQIAAIAPLLAHLDALRFRLDARTRAAVLTLAGEA